MYRNRVEMPHVAGYSNEAYKKIMGVKSLVEYCR